MNCFFLYIVGLGKVNYAINYTGTFPLQRLDYGFSGWSIKFLDSYKYSFNFWLLYIPYYGLIHCINRETLWSPRSGVYRLGMFRPSRIFCVGFPVIVHDGLTFVTSLFIVHRPPSTLTPLMDLRAEAPGPPRTQISLICCFMKVCRKIGPPIGWHPFLRKILDQPLLSEAGQSEAFSDFYPIDVDLLSFFLPYTWSETAEKRLQRWPKVVERSHFNGCDHFTDIFVLFQILKCFETIVVQSCYFV